MGIWVFFTILAATMQAVRTAGQKQLAKTISPMAATLVRYLFGLPFVLAYLYGVTEYYDAPIPDLKGRFIFFASLAAVTQIGATAALVKAMMYRNFAVGTTLAKTEAIQTAWIGAAFFGASLSFFGWVSIIIGLVGALIISQVKFGIQDLTENVGARFGLASGLGFALTSLWLREASLSLDAPLILNAAVTLAFIVSIQTVLCLLWIGFREREQFAKILRHPRTSTFVGFTSATGSVGWFTAITLENAALVKTLGQVEFFVTLALTYFFFKERVRKFEYAGMALILASVILLLLGK